MCVCGGGGGVTVFTYFCCCCFLLFLQEFSLKYLQIFTSLLCFFSPALLNNSNDE